MLFDCLNSKAEPKDAIPLEDRCLDFFTFHFSCETSRFDVLEIVPREPRLLATAAMYSTICLIRFDPVLLFHAYEIISVDTHGGEAKHSKTDMGKRLVLLFHLPYTGAPSPRLRNPFEHQAVWMQFVNCRFD